MGLSLSDIVALFTVWEASHSGDERKMELTAIVGKYMEEVETRRRALDLVERELNLILEVVSNCEGCRRPPAEHTCTKCSVVKGRNELPELVAIWSKPNGEIHSRKLN